MPRLSYREYPALFSYNHNTACAGKPKSKASCIGAKCGFSLGRAGWGLAAGGILSGLLPNAENRTMRIMIDRPDSRESWESYFGERPRRSTLRSFKRQFALEHKHTEKLFKGLNLA